METPAIYEGAKALTTKGLFSQENVRKKFEELLGKRAPQFIASVLQITASNDLLAKAEPHSVLNAAAMAATLDLPLNASLGFAYIIPYNDRKAGKCLAQFQIGYKGFIQLAQRSGQFKTIASTPIYEGQIVEMNPLTGFKFDFALKTSDKVVGYAAFFSLVTGFEKTFYMSVDDVKKHAGKYSQSFKNGYGVWKDNFDEMACKTVTKLLLAKYAPMSVEMEKAAVADQAIIMNDSGTDVTYIDNHEEIPLTKEDIQRDRLQKLIDNAKSADDLVKIRSQVPAEMHDLFNEIAEGKNF